MASIKSSDFGVLVLPFIEKRSNLGIHIAFNCYVSIVPFQLEEFLLDFHDLDSFKNKLSTECPTIWVCPMISHDKIHFMYFWQEYHKSTHFFTVHSVK